MATSKPIRILIVDDHDLVCAGLHLLLERNGPCNVVATCGNGAAAIRLVDELMPDLVLMDVMLEDGDGIACTRVIRAAHPEVKVLVLTAQLDAGVQVRAKAAGAQGCLAKTRAADELVAAVLAVMAGESCFIGMSDKVIGAPRKKSPNEGERLHLPLRESEVLEFLLQGLRNKEIAAELKLSVKTIETYRARLMKRFDVTSAAALVRHAIRAGLAEP